MDVELSKISYQTLHFGIAYFYGHNLLTQGLSSYVRTCILDKKDPPEDEKLPDPSGPLSKIILLSSIANCNAEVTKVMKQATLSVTKNCYTKLTPAR